MKKQNIRRLISLATAVSFLLSQALAPVPLFAAGNPSSEVRVPSEFQINLPPELGTIQTLSPGKGPTLIHIQDAHGNYEAQKKIQAILHYLRDQYGVKLLLLEGNDIKLKNELIRLYPHYRDITREVLDGLAKDAVAQGEELFLAEAPEVEAYGVENLEAYLANGGAFKAVITQREKSEGFIRDMDIEIERLTGPYLNKDLRAYLGRLENFEAKRLSIVDWLSYLKAQAKAHAGIDLSDYAWQIDWPALVRVFKLAEFETRLNLKAYPEEKEAFLKAISSIPRQTHESVEKILASPLSRHQLPDPETGLLFRDMVAALPADFNYDRYPNVKMFIGHLILQSEVKGDWLIREMNGLTDLISERLAKTPEEKKILGLLKDHRLLKRLFALELTPEDYDSIWNHSNVGARDEDMRPTAILHRFESLNASKRVRNVQFSHIEEIDSLFNKALEFYAGARERDGWMIQNIEARLRETGADKAVVITGGFHAGPFTDYFSKHGFNYALIAPKITTTEGREAYIQSLLKFSMYKPPARLGYDYSELRSRHINPGPLDAVIFEKTSKAAAQRGLPFYGIVRESPRYPGVVFKQDGRQIEVALPYGHLRFPTQMATFREETERQTPVLNAKGAQLIESAPTPRSEARMLVLSRKRDESIIIGDNIVITVVDIRGDKVRLGIHAPTEIPVHRKEVYEAIQAQAGQAPAVIRESPTPASGGGHLVVSRQRDESIIIGDNIVITVVDIRGDKVRLGIQAPTEIPVHRKEVYEAIQKEENARIAAGGREPRPTTTGSRRNKRGRPLRSEARGVGPYYRQQLAAVRALQPEDFVYKHQGEPTIFGKLFPEILRLADEAGFGKREDVVAVYKGADKVRILKPANPDSNEVRVRRGDVFVISFKTLPRAETRVPALQRGEPVREPLLQPAFGQATVGAPERGSVSQLAGRVPAEQPAVIGPPAQSVVTPVIPGGREPDETTGVSRQTPVIVQIEPGQLPPLNVIRPEQVVVIPAGVRGLEQFVPGLLPVTPAVRVRGAPLPAAGLRPALVVLGAVAPPAQGDAPQPVILGFILQDRLFSFVRIGGVPAVTPAQVAPALPAAERQVPIVTNPPLPFETPVIQLRAGVPVRVNLVPVPAVPLPALAGPLNVNPAPAARAEARNLERRQLFIGIALNPESPPDVRLQAIQSIGASGRFEISFEAPQTGYALLNILENPNESPAIRAAIAKTLGQILELKQGPIESLLTVLHPVLVQADLPLSVLLEVTRVIRKITNSDNFRYSRSVEISIVLVIQRLIFSLKRLEGTVKPNVSAEILGNSQQIFVNLLQLAATQTGNSPEVRVMLIKALREIRDLKMAGEGVPLFRDLFSHPAPVLVQIEALSAFAERVDVTNVESLKADFETSASLLTTNIPLLQKAVVEATQSILKRVPPEEQGPVVEPFLKLISDSEVSPEVRVAAIQALTPAVPRAELRRLIPNLEAIERELGITPSIASTKPETPEIAGRETPEVFSRPGPPGPPSTQTTPPKNETPVTVSAQQPETPVVARVEKPTGETVPTTPSAPSRPSAPPTVNPPGVSNITTPILPGRITPTPEPTRVTSEAVARFFTPVDQQVTQTVRFRIYPLEFAALERFLREGILIGLGVPEAHAAVAGSTGVSVPAFSTLEEISGAAGRTVVTPAYLQGLQDKYAGRAADSAGAVVIDSFWVNKLIEKPNALLNLFRIIDTIQAAAKTKKPVVSLMGSGADMKRIREALLARENENGITNIEDRILAAHFAGELNRLVGLVEMAQGESVVGAENRYLEANPGTGTLNSLILEGLSGDVNFVVGGNLSRDVEIMPVVIEKVLEAASVSKNLRSLNANESAQFLQAQLIREIGRVVSIVKQGGQSFLVIQSLTQFIESLRNQRFVAVAA